jgi:dolichol-phosphate mannosyltransferase
MAKRTITSKIISERYEFRPKKTKYCICIPVINEGKKIQKQLIRMQAVSSVADIIICDGGSTDKSLTHSFLKKHGVRTLIVKKIPGKQGTQFRIGFEYAIKEGYKGIITIDGNNKDNPEAILDFIKHLNKGYDYIQGSRFIKGGKAINNPLSRLLGIRLFMSPLLSIAAKFWYTDITNGYRAFSIRYLTHPQVDIFRDIFSSYELLFYLTVRANQIGLKTLEIPVTRTYPKGLIPTKIIGWKGNMHMIKTALKVSLGYYHPKH